MLIKSVEIDHYRYSPEGSRHAARVRMTLRDRVVTTFCQVIGGAEMDTAARAEALVRDALRQLRRMPEFRSGGTSLELAPELDRVPFRHAA